MSTAATTRAGVTDSCDGLIVNARPFEQTGDGRQCPSHGSPPDESRAVAGVAAYGGEGVACRGQGFYCCTVGAQLAPPVGDWTRRREG